MLFKGLNIANNVKSIFFPEVCLSCNNFLVLGEKTICTSCRHHLPVTNFQNEKNNRVEKLFYGRVAIENACAFFWFSKNSIVQRLIHNLKYKNHEEIGFFLGNWLGNELSNTDFGTADIIIPVPMHPKKLKQRRYNQLTVFGKTLGKKLEIPFDENILIQIKKTSSQTTKSKEDRWRQKEDAFKIRGNPQLRNKHIVLIDDVITTGATLEACAKTLKNYQNCRISIVSIAITA